MLYIYIYIYIYKENTRISKSISSSNSIYQSAIHLNLKRDDHSFDRCRLVTSVMDEYAIRTACNEAMHGTIVSTS